ncbi:enhanced entry virulence factor RtxA [Legionella pneumophila]|uniref:enhanced entry virulence factor RtxA n=28 Tax=Legionella pneumophila TaxID=446 RepID=UPI000D060323|nr:enhanced entry virulence factor RtxA [Legionella pneumophila]
MLVESVIGIVRAVNGLLEKVNAQGQASLVKSGARLQEGDVLTLLSGEAYIQFIHGFPEALALGKPVNLYGVSPALQYGVEELNEQLVQEALAKGIDPSVILDVLGSAAAGAEAVGSGGDAFIIDPLFGFGQVTAGYPTGPIAFGYEADTQHLFWYVPEETGAIAESELTTEPESIPQIPQFNSNQATVIVFEDALTGGIQDSAGQVTTARASLSPLISSSSEVASSFAFNTNLSALPTLKSGGIELDYILSSDRLALTASMPDGTNVARFELTADGQLTQILIGAIDHPTSDSDDNEWMRFDLSPVIDVTFTRTSDGTVLESRTLPDNAVVAGIQDDVPIARAQLTNNEILLDETVGVKVGDADAANDDFNPTTTADPFNNAYGIPTGLVQNANLLDTSTSEMGGDYKNATMTHLLKITDAVSGLQTTNGTPINLFLESNGDITGRAGDIGAPALFAIRMNPNTGAISVAQYGPIKQFDTNSHDEAVDLTGRISAVVTAKDSDGDVSNVEIPIGQLIIFEDDGPSIVVSGATQTLTVDESVLATNDTQSFAGLFTPSFGADGAAAANALSYSLGVSANGAASGVLDTASGNQVFLFLENGIVVGREGSDALDAATGDVVFNISVDGSGNVTLDQVRAVVHDNPLDPDESTGPTQLSAANLVTLTAIATDKDGDSASATANIGLSFNFEDDGPSIVVSGATQTLTVDESVLTTNDTQSFAGLFTPSFGADGAAAANALSYSLGVSANGAASGVLDTASGNQVFLFLENGIVVGREGSDALDAATGDVVFNISVDGSGNVTLDQVRAVVHDNPLDPDESTGPTQLSAANLVTLTAIATDKDGDSASATANIGLSFNFEDDGPSIVVSGATQTLTVDESVLTTNDTQSFAGLFTPSFGADGAAAANALSYSLGVSANGAASGVLDTASGNQVFLFLENGIVVGREGSDALDAATGDVVFNISVDGSGNVTLDQVRAVVHDNPLDPDESTGPTQLSAANLVTLTAIATDKDGDSASATANIGLSFNFEDDGPSIVVSGATQTLTVDESVLTTNDTQSFAGLFTPSFGADGAAAANALSYSLGVSANGAASGVLDTASGNQVFLFLENGIVVGREGSDALDAATGDVVFNISVDGSGNVTLDQVRAVVHDNPLDPDESTGPTQLSAANLVTLTAIATDKDGDSASATANIGLSFNFEDDGPSIVVSGATQTLTVDESVLATNDTQSFAGLFTPSFGADGAAAANALSYSLGVSANGAASGVLDTASGNQVFLFLENGIVVGREGSDALDAATGDVVFNISVDGSGNVTLDQVRAVVHDNPLDPDESTGPTQLSAANLVTLTAIATDKDGDSASATANIGLSFNFEDDGPSIVVSGTTQTLTVDESVLATNDTQSFAGLFTPSFGADGAAAANALSYSLGVSANGAASGVLDTASGNQVFLFLENGIVVGREGSDALDAATGDVVFNISVDGSGNVTLDQVRAVVHDNPLDPDESTGPTQLSAANLVTLTAIATDKDGDSASATANIGLSFNFEDDGPSIVVSGATQTLTVDESVLTTNDTQSFAGLFTPSFGADGAAAANALSYSLGVSANGAASGVLDTASGNQVFLFLENGIVVGREGSDALDAATGDVVFNISVDGSGNVTLDQVRAVVHDNPLDPDESTGPTQLSAANLVTLTAIATDKDGDSASATANIGLSFNFEDDGPSIVVSGTTQTLTVDESVLATNDTQSFAGLFTPSFGADGAAAANALSYSLGVSANGAASGVLDTASGNQVFLFLENGIVVGREGSDALDAATGDVVFNISVDGSGNVTLDQVRAVVHDNPLDPDESTGPTQLSAANLVTLTAIATDKDGDSASATANIGLSFNFEDDGPSIVVSGATQTLTVDESVLTTNDTQSFAGLFTPSFGADGAAAANALSYSLGVSANGAASGVLDTASGNQVFLFLENGIVVGREGSDALDAATGDVVFNISVDGSGNVTLDQVRAVVHDNPLDPDESTGPTQLSAANLVTLTAIATDKDGDSASATANIGLSFNFEDDGPSIVVSGATQTLTVDESVLATNDTQSFAGLFTPSFGADGAAAANALSYSLGVSANGAASGVLDTASGNQVFLFLENGIVVGREGSDALDAATGDVVFNISVDGSGNVTLDQVRAVVHDNPLDPDESTGPTQLSAANLVTLTAIATDKDGDSASATANIGLSFNFEDDGPSIVVSGATQTLTVDESVLTTNDTQSFAGLFTPSFGADGAAAANALSYSLGVSANGAASGVLDTASGNQVFLFLENGIVVGREGSDALDAATGDVVFNISVDGSGNVTLDQVRAVVHDNPLDPDESTGPTQLSAANLVTLTAIATDKDGDSASATANIGLSFNFEDDGPSIVVSGATQTLTVDESVLTTNDTQSFAGLFTPSFGADGAAAANALSYSLGVSANGAASGVLDTASGNQVFLFLENGIVVGREGSDALDAATGDVVFNISVDGSGNVTLDQVRAVVHDNPLDPDESTGPTQLSAANLVTLTAIATDKDGDSASATANIGLSFNFEDDGPSIVVSGTTQTLTVDESVLATNDTQSFAGLFTPSFGADGAAAANALSYSLGVSANGAASGVLDTASGNQVFLFLENGIVVGREGSDALDAATGDVVFNISVDGSGNVTLDQVRAVVHDNPLDPDESTGPTQLSAANLVTLTAIATDKDGDSASATANIGLSFNFEDDGPSIVVSGATQTLTVDESVLTTNDTQSFAGLFTPSFGADGAAAANALSYSLGVSANGAASGVLDTASGNQVFLFLENGIVVGREGSDALDAATGDVVFNISVDGSGNVTLDQVRAVVHDNPLDPDESTGPTQLSAANLVTLTAIATDKDGDSASATANIGLSFNFEDDGPSIVVSGATQTLTVDESVLATNDTQSFAGLFTPSFGADGAAAANALSYSLGVSANGAASGVLDTASGNQVFLFLENGIVVGREGSDALDAATGDVVFNISVDGSGNVTLDQVRAVVHDNPLDPDESTGPTQLSAANLVTLTAIATDKDGDSASATANIGLSFNFEDDGPSIVVSGATQTLTVDESVLATNDTQSFAGLFTPSFGADGAAAANALSYSLGVSANGAASGVLDTASGNQVFLFLENGIVVGREGSDALDAATGDVVFNISVDGSGNVTLDQVRAVVHDNPLDPDESTGPTQLSAANLVTLTAIATDKDGDSASATANIGLSFNFEDDGPSIVVSGTTQTLTVDESVLATNDTQSFAGLFTPSFGADGAAAANALSYSLGVSANGAASGVLDTASGNQVFLFLENGIVVGREGSDALDAATGDVVFNISVDGSGNVTLDQVRAVVHDNPLDPDESTGPTQLSAANLVTLTAIATDKDGDSASATANIGLSFNFEDDGPSIVVSGATQTLTVDESVLATNDTQSFAGLFTPSFGADGAAAANALSYSLGVSANGAASGVLDTASGNQVFLFLENGIVVGREGSDALDAATGDVVFNISVDGSGNVTLDQVRAVVHDNPLDPDESTGPTQLSAANLVTLTAIATDKDGDSASATANIGLSFNFEDDGPSIVVSGTTQTLTVDESVLATNDTQSFAGLFTPSFGADGAAAANALSYSLGVSANGAASGVLDTASGNQVFLFLENGIVVGREGSDALDAATGDVVFNISVDGSGNVTLDQVRAVVHDNPLDPDESTGPTQLSAANLVTLTAIATDKDGDSASATANIGLSFNFEDDGPSIVVSGATQTLTVDESVLTTNDTQSFAGLFTPSFGADGAAAANALSYSLGVSANGAASGVLDTASGNQVFLFLENGIVVGREGSDALDAATGDVVFNISVDGSGNVTLDQVRAVVHDNPLDPDESTGPTQLSAANLVTLTAIATDKDGDSASATANIGLSFNFEDDGPSIVVSGATQTLTVDESVLATNDTQSFAGLFTPSFGADGAAAANALSYSLGVSANGAASGVLDTASGNQVFLFLENGIVVGREGSDALDAATGDVVFNISVDGSGNVTLDQVRAVVHDNPLDPDESTGPTQLSAANLVTLTAIATDKDGDSASATANIGLSFNFEDDGPVASTNKLTGVVDEDGLTGGIAGGVGDVAGQAVAASGNVATLFQSGADAPLTYSLNANTSGLPALSSGGVALTYAVSGNTLTASAGSTQVFTFTLNANGNYSFTLLAKLDHPAGADENDITINLGSVIRATDSDGDTVTAAADGLVITVDDDTPIASANKLTGVVDEDGLTGGIAGGVGDVAGQAVAASGNVATLFQSGADAPLTYSLNASTSGLPALSSGGVALTYAVSGNTLTASAGSTQVFTFTLNANGNYSFTLLAKLDHPAGADENDITINLGSVIRATDSDGDTVTAAADGLVITVDDDTPIASANKLTGVVDEDGLTGGIAGGVGDVAGQAVAASGNVATLFQSGADAPLTYSLNANTSGLPALSSGGVALTYAVSGDTLTASAGSTQVFTFTLNANGNYSFTLLAKLDHPAGADENDITINLGSVIRATDSDGDTVTAAADGLVITVDDDTPIASANKLTGVVDEDGLTGGIAGGVGDVAGQAVAASGNVATLFQSGADAPLTYSLNANTSGLPALSSGGVALTYAVSGDTLTASAGSTQVFTFTLNANGNYSFTLLAKLDHPAGADENDITINLGSVIRATDSDGDTVTAAADGLVITVDDDTPIASANKLTGVVDEDGLTGGIAGGVGDVAGQAVAASGNVATLFQSGADAPLTYSLNASTSGLPALSSGGVALTYAVSGNTLTASAGSTQVFTFTLNANGNYSFTLLAKLDHPAGADENDITINLGSVIRATDSDGDTVTAAADGLVITVDDDTPIASANKLTGVVDEDGLTGGIAGGVGDVAGQAVAASGNVATLFQSGADAPLTYSLNANTSGLPALSSGGVALTYAVSGNTLTASAGSTQIFTFTLNANGNYSFTLLAKLDHPAGADENDITINLGSVIRATDSDGDTVTAAADGLVITVDDDTPIASANKLTGVVDEDGLTGGIAGGVGDVAGQAVAASGNVATLFQSGADAPLTYSLNASTSGLPALSSGGVALTYAVSGNTLTASAGSTQIFTFTLNANGNYSFTLLAKLDHPAGADENDITINLGSVIRATDSDGDTVTAAADGLVITVDDDTPIASANKLTGVVDEDGLTGGIAGGVGDVAGQAVAASGNVATLFQSGADAPLTYSLNASTSGLPALSSGGVALTYAVSGNTLTASAGSTQVFTFTLNANGNYSFTLLAKLDHPAGADENDITINLGSVIRATDSDGDTVTAAADGLVITVDDDTPIASANKLTGVVDEDGLTGGIAGGVGDVAGQAVAASGNVATLFQSGADAPLTYSLNASTSGLPALSSGGVALTYAVSGNTLTASAGSTQVFTFTLNANGNYSFTLLAKLDHPAGADENDITINLGSVIRATDSDGDTVTAAADGLVITVDDDTPVAITPEEGFVSNKAGVVKVFNLDLDSNIGNNVGADQPGSIRFINVVDGQQAQGIIDGELVNLTTVNGQLIKLYISNDGLIITGSTAATEGAINSSNTVFKVTMLPDNDYNLANDKYSVEMFGKIGVINTVNFSDLTGDSPAGNVSFKIISDQDFPGYEVLITPKDRINPDDTVGGTVNSSSTDISISNQWIDQGSGDSEILRLDYGQFAIVNNKFNIEKHFTVNGASFEIPQIQGSSSSRASINVKAFDANDNNQLNDDPLDAITRVVIFTSSGGVETVIADVASNTSVGGMTFNFLGTNGVNITGLQAHYQVRAYTADGYNRLEIDNISSTPFSIGGLGIQAIIDTEKEVKMTYDVRLTDSDGDSVDSSFDVNIAPSLLKVGENINDTSSSNVPHTVGNDVGVIDGGRGADVLVGDVGGVKDVRIAFVLDESGSMSQNFGGSTRMDVLKQVMTDVLTELGNTPNANITVHLVKFASIVNGTGTFNITGGELQNALDFISGLQIQQGNLAGTNYEAALGQTALWFNSLTGAADVQQTLFLTDGAPTLYMDGNSTDYTNINAVYGHGNQTEEVLWENLFGEHAGNQATVDLFNYLNESNSRDLDGTQSYSVDTDGDGDFETVSVNARSSGTTQSTSDLVRSTADNVNEVQALQAHGTLRAVSIANNVSVYLQDIDSTGQPYVASSPGLLQDILNELNPFNSLNPVGSDIIQGNEADDLIFGDTLFTDKLAEDEGLNLRKGSGWDVFEELEASHGWSRQDTLNYIASHADELGKETVLSNGSTRSGGHDTISGGQGNDRIYGQEGNDIIDGGAGNDVIVGGTGNDTLTGGSGADQFVLVKGQGGASVGAAPIDTITDFEVNIDKIVINGNNITGVSVSTPVSNTYTITVNYSDAATEHFKMTLSNGALLNDSGKTHLNGVVISGGTATIDGTIVGAVLYLDLNANNQEDEGERLGITDQYGHVEWVVDLSKFDVNGDGQYVIGEARAVQTGGFDIDTGLSYEINLYGPVGSAVISPLTSLLQAQLEAGMDYETANSALVACLGLPEGTQIISFNPITGSGEVLAQNAGVMTAAIQFSEIAAIHYSTDEGHVSFAVFEAISKALLELPEGVVADFGDEGFLQSIANYLGLDALVTSEMIDYMATSQKALEASILTLAPGEDALTAISKIQHVTQGVYAQAIEMALIGYLPLDALKNMSAVLKAYADGDITDEQLNSFEDKLSAVIVNWEDNNVTDASHQATLQTERTVDDSSVKSEANHEMAQEVNAVINDFMDEHDISLYYYDQQAQMTQETQEEQQPVEAQAEETVIHDDIVQDLLLDDHSLTMLANNPELNGGNGNDVLHGTTGNDFIRGGQGNDTMTGGGGVDTFFWLSGDDDGGVDTITDFKANPVDQSSDASVLNLSDLLSDADLETNSLDNYLNVSTTEEGDTAIKVDPNGNGNFDAPAQTIILEDVDLTAVFATNNSHDIVNQMIANGNLIVEQ